MRALVQNPWKNIALALAISLAVSASASLWIGWMEASSAASDVSSLWRWSLRSWSSVIVDADGQKIKIVHEPFATFRNFSLMLMGLVCAVACIARKLEAKAPETDLPAKLGTTTTQLDGEMGAIIRLVQGYLDKNRNYSHFLREGHTALASATTSDQIKKAIYLLISENQRMMQDTEEYERSLAESRSQIANLRTTLEETHEQTIRDALTSCYNRRYFDATLEKELKEAGQCATPVSLILADIDHFKSINDQHGHPIGDEALKHFADLLHNTVTKHDTVARYGGEEFAIILPKANLAQATRTAEKIKEWLNERQWLVKGGVRISKITASFGVSQWRPGERPLQLVKRADDNLYRSKSQGRNRVTANGARN
jgi:diguanylate cyclase